MKFYGINISLLILKRRFSFLGLLRRSFVFDDELRSVIEKEFGGSGCFVGYCKMWVWFRMKGIVVKRVRVMIFFREFDFDGVESR